MSQDQVTQINEAMAQLAISSKSQATGFLDLPTELAEILLQQVLEQDAQNYDVQFPALLTAIEDAWPKLCSLYSQRWNEQKLKRTHVIVVNDEAVNLEDKFPSRQMSIVEFQKYIKGFGKRMRYLEHLRLVVSEPETEAIRESSNPWCRDDHKSRSGCGLVLRSFTIKLSNNLKEIVFDISGYDTYTMSNNRRTLSSCLDVTIESGFELLSASSQRDAQLVLQLPSNGPGGVLKRFYSHYDLEIRWVKYARLCQEEVVGEKICWWFGKL